MVLRAVARTRTAGLARSIDRGPSCRPGAGDPERFRRGPARQRAREPDQRTRRRARRQPALRSGLQRQFRVSRERRNTAAYRYRSRESRAGHDPQIQESLQPWRSSHLPRELKSIQVLVRFFLRMAILGFRGVRQHRIRQEPRRLFWMAAILSAVDRRHAARAAFRHDSQPLGRNDGLCSFVLPGHLFPIRTVPV